MYASSFHIGKKTLSFEKGVARSAAIGARVAGAPQRHPSPDMVPAMDPGAPTQDQQAPMSPLPPPPPPPPPSARPIPYQAPSVPPPKARPAQPAVAAGVRDRLGRDRVGYAAVWETSRVIGLSTWWLGADAEPRILLIQLLPFYGPILVTVAAISNWRYVALLRDPRRPRRCGDRRRRSRQGALDRVPSSWCWPARRCASVLPRWPACIAR